jgi:hypothetical protein
METAVLCSLKIFNLPVHGEDCLGALYEIKIPMAENMIEEFVVSVHLLIPLYLVPFCSSYSTLTIHYQ